MQGTNFRKDEFSIVSPPKKGRNITNQENGIIAFLLLFAQPSVFFFFQATFVAVHKFLSAPTIF